jgi:hypothetical protein
MLARVHLSAAVSMRVARVLSLALALSAVGCDCGAKPSKPVVPPTLAERPPIAPPEPAVLEGFVHLAQGAALPSFKPEHMERAVLEHTKRGAWPEKCTPPKIADMTPMLETPDGKLSGVVVAASGFKRGYARAPKIHEVVIRDCRLTPSTVVAMKGDTLRVKSEVDFPFMPAYGPPDQIKTLIPGQNYDTELKDAGSAAVTCGFMAPCGRTDVIVLNHPLATVTDEKGNFRMGSFPAGERVKVTAWHPLLAESEIEVEVAPGETKSVELSVRPVASP